MAPPFPNSHLPGTLQPKSRFEGLKFLSNIKVRVRPKRPARKLCESTTQMKLKQQKRKIEKSILPKKVEESWCRCRRFFFSLLILGNDGTVTFTDSCLEQTRKDCNFKLNDMNDVPGLYTREMGSRNAEVNLIFNVTARKSVKKTTKNWYYVQRWFFSHFLIPFKTPINSLTNKDLNFSVYTTE